MAFDYEGVTKQRVPLIEAGVCAGLVFDSQTAARGRRPSTGHGLPAPNPYGPFPLNTVMAGVVPREELIGGLDRGPPGHPLPLHEPGPSKARDRDRHDPRRHVPCGGGQIVGPVRNLRFTQTYLEAIAGQRRRPGAARRSRASSAAGVVPALRIDAWTFTGATEH